MSLRNLGLTVALLATLGTTNCGNLNGRNPAPVPAADTRTVFQQKTDVNVNPLGYTCSYSSNTQYTAVNPNTGLENTISVDERAVCVATGEADLDINLVDRSTNGPTAIETQLTALPPQPYFILVGQGQNVGTTIDMFYQTTNF